MFWKASLWKTNLFTHSRYLREYDALHLANDGNLGFSIEINCLFNAKYCKREVKTLVRNITFLPQLCDAIMRTSRSFKGELIQADKWRTWICQTEGSAKKTNLTNFKVTLRGKLKVATRSYRVNFIYNLTVHLTDIRSLQGTCTILHAASSHSPVSNVRHPEPNRSTPSKRLIYMSNSQQTVPVIGLMQAVSRQQRAADKQPNTCDGFLISSINAGASPGEQLCAPRL